jgi:hypothetical protein
MTLAAARALARSFRVQIRYGASLFKALRKSLLGVRQHRVNSRSAALLLIPCFRAQ